MQHIILVIPQNHWWDNKKMLKIGKTLYSKIIKEVIMVSSTETAEMVKLLENTFRTINIGLANEIAIMCEKLRINVWEVTMRPLLNLLAS